MVLLAHNSHHLEQPETLARLPDTSQNSTRTTTNLAPTCRWGAAGLEPDALEQALAGRGARRVAGREHDVHAVPAAQELPELRDLEAPQPTSGGGAFEASLSQGCKPGRSGVSVRGPTARSRQVRYDGKPARACEVPSPCRERFGPRIRCAAVGSVKNVLAGVSMVLK